MDSFVTADAWTPKEHEAFLRALEEHGQGTATGDVWSKIAKAVGTKSASAVKDHAHNYFIKLQAESYTAQHVRFLARRTRRPCCFSHVCTCNI